MAALDFSVLLDPIIKGQREEIARREEENKLQKQRRYDLVTSILKSGSSKAIADIGSNGGFEDLGIGTDIIETIQSDRESTENIAKAKALEAKRKETFSRMKDMIKLGDVEGAREVKRRFDSEASSFGLDGIALDTNAVIEAENREQRKALDAKSLGARNTAVGIITDSLKLGDVEMAKAAIDDFNSTFAVDERGNGDVTKSIGYSVIDKYIQDPQFRQQILSSDKTGIEAVMNHFDKKDTEAFVKDEKAKLAAFDNTLNNIQQLGDLLNEGIPEGGWGEIMKGLKSLATGSGLESLATKLTGINDDELANAETYESIIKEMMTDLTTKLSGAISNFELKEIEKSLPSLSRSNKGKEQILTRIEESIARARDKIQAKSEWAETRGHTNGFDAHWKEYDAPRSYQAKGKTKDGKTVYYRKTFNDLYMSKLKNPRIKKAIITGEKLDDGTPITPELIKMQALKQWRYEMIAAGKRVN